MKLRSLLTGAAALAVTAAAFSAPVAAQAGLIWTSQLEYRDGLVGPQTPYGTVTLEEVSPTEVKVTVTLANALSKFINTGGPHDPFLFNTISDNAVTIQAPVDTFVDGGHGSFNATPFGILTDKIACCNNKNGASAGDLPPLVFSVANAAGITFAGIGYTVDVDGRLLTMGTGEHFTSNAGGWWFTADIYDGATGQTYNVAAKDAFTDPPIVVPPLAVPEPATWGLMITGFAGMGAMLRRRRAQPATA